jgi:hypothetical protein
MLQNFLERPPAPMPSQKQGPDDGDRASLRNAGF